MISKKKKVSIYDIAQRLGVSASTVSRALQDHHSIGAEMKQLVRKTAEEMDYKPNRVALSLKLGKNNAIGVLVPHINRNFFSSVIEGIQQTAAEKGYDVLICQSNESYSRECQLLSALSQGKVDGVIASIAAGTQDVAHFNRLEQYGIPLVLFDRVSPEIPAAMKVVVNDYRGAYQVVEHLYNQGCRRIFHYAGPQHVSVWKHRLEGYCDAMKDLGLKTGRESIVYGEDMVREEGERLIREVMRMKRKPDAIFFTSDFVALGALVEMKKQGLSAPDDIAVVGFANEPFDEWITPSLTSVEQYSCRMGELAAKMLIDKIDGETPGDIVIEPQLIVRESSRKNKE